jgi:DGQHR domain-containing protein
MITMTSPTTNFPAMQGAVGTRLVTYSTQLPAASIEGLLGHDPRSRYWKKLPGDIASIYEKVQRNTSPGRTASIAAYISSRFSKEARLIGAFPAISVAVQNHIKFVPFSDKNPGVGDIQIEMSSRNSRIVVDGLGRLSGVLDLLERMYDAPSGSEELERLTELLTGFSIPVVIYAPHPDSPPLSREEMGQLFFDFNFKTTPVQAKHAISLDRSDPYIQATNALALESKAISSNGGMEERAASLGSKSTAIVVQQVLLRFVRGAMEGAAFQESNKAQLDKPYLNLENLDENIERMGAFLDAFAEEMSDRFADRKSLHLSSPGWQTLGLIFNDVAVRLRVPDITATARALARVDWARSGPLWSDLVATVKNKAGEDELVLRTAGASAKREMLKQIRAAIGIDRLLEPGPTDAAESDDDRIAA